MKIRYVGYSVLVFLLSLLVACAGTTDPSEAYKGETAQQIFQGGEDALRDNDYAEAIKRFEALDVQYPYGRNTETAQLHIIYAYYKNSDFPATETAADRFIHAYPTSPNVAYAYYLHGLATYYQNMGVFERLFAIDFATRDLTQVKKAFNDFSTITTRYPDSPYAPAAHQYMIYLRNVLANHQVEVAEFYFNHQAYVAAANRASIVVEHYQGAPVVPDALVIMAKSYYQLHQTDLENETIRVINFNYPASVYSREVSGDQLSSKRIKLYSPSQQKSLPTPQQSIVAPPAPVTTVALSTNYQTHNNGYRGPTPTVAELVTKMRSGKALAKPEQALVQQTLASNPQAINNVKKPSRITLADLWKKLNPMQFSDAQVTAPTVVAAPAHPEMALQDTNGGHR